MGHNESSVREKFITLRALVKKVERSYTNNLTAYMKALENKQTHPRGIEDRK